MAAAWKMGYIKTSSHHRIFAIRSGSDGVDDYLANHLLGAFTTKSMKIEPVVQGKEFFCFLPSLLYLFLHIFFFFAYFVWNDNPFCSQNTCEMSEVRCVCDGWRWSISWCVALYFFRYFNNHYFSIFLVIGNDGTTRLQQDCFPRNASYPTGDYSTGRFARGGLRNSLLGRTQG